VRDTGTADVVVEARNRIGAHAQGFRVRVGLPSTIRRECSAGGFALSPVYPNPAEPWNGVSFMCTLPAQTPVLFRVFDMGGKEIREYGLGVLDGGTHVLRWDGCDTRGVPVPPGVYTLEISTGNTAARTVAIVR
ncbi:MAG: FlgD immunoglobulin-like domain containing protein, partial [Bacteroidota bacterium]|nr:FlgD immunoglobulin-like domain containing protein [Bacteroidota bacterium]